MRVAVAIALGAMLLSGAAEAADYKVLRTLQAPPPIQLSSLPAGTTARPVEFARVVFHPKEGEAWALAYESMIAVGGGETAPPPQLSELLTWDSGRMDGETATFARAFDEELKKAGFAAAGTVSLFGDKQDAADLKVAVLVDDIKGRFCVDCPNLFNRKGVPASVVMTAHWEVYSSLERKVIARIDTTGGANHMTKLQGSIIPPVLTAFREHVRQLLASEEFRRVVTAGAAAPNSTPPATSQSTIAFSAAAKAGGIPQASKSVATVFAADGHGSGFLVSQDGYVLTNQHVVGGSKYVKLKWNDGSETLGEVVRADSRRDVALIKTDAKGRAPLALRHTTAVQGETVFAIGTPLDERLQSTLTKGIVSATRDYEGQLFIQSDVGVTNGNSGGPLLDEKGAVLGLTVLGLYPDKSKSLNLFIPIDDALRALALKPAG
jgi:S1-C subfamily serine protease